MYKVLIADDEPKVCRLIEKVVDWKTLGLEIAGVVENGIQALAAIKEQDVDIVITDIRMPGYDGLELIRRAKEINAQIGFVIISGHRQFDYAQKAIRYGVEDYLLKPIDEKELAKILKKMVAGRESSRGEQEHKYLLERQIEKNSEQLRQNFIKTLVNESGGFTGLLDLERINAEYQCHFQDGIYQMLVIKADITCREYRNEAYQLLTRQVQRIAETELTPGSMELLTCVKPEGVYVLLNIDETYEKELRKRLKNIRANICTLRDLFWEIQATVGMGCAVNDFSQIQISAADAKRAILNRIFLGVNHTIGVQSKTASRLSVRELADSKIRFSLIESIETLNQKSVLNLLHELCIKVKNENDMDGQLLLEFCSELVEILIFTLKKMCADEQVSGLKEEFQEAFYMCVTVEDVFNRVKESFAKGIQSAEKMKELNETRPIRNVKRYIEEHYNEPVKLEDVSSMIGFHPNYFSGMFKEQTGMKFSEYLIHIRMEKAKQFLIQGEMAVAVIAEEIGYNDTKHFYKTFKKYTGLTPREFSRLYQKLH